MIVYFIFACYPL